MDFTLLMVLAVWGVVILVMRMIWAPPSGADVSRGGLKLQAYYLVPLFVIVALYGLLKLAIGM